MADKKILEVVEEDELLTILEMQLLAVYDAQAKVGTIETQNTRARNDAIVDLLATIVGVLDGS